MTLLLCAFALAEPFRTTATLTAGADGGVPSAHGALDYGVMRRIALIGEAGVTRDLAVSASGGLLVLPVDGEWVRAGVALMPEVRDLAGTPAYSVRGGVRAGYLMFWGLGLAARADVAWAPGVAPELQAGLGLSVRM